MSTRAHTLICTVMADAPPPGVAVRQGVRELASWSFIGIMLVIVVAVGAAVLLGLNARRSLWHARREARRPTSLKSAWRESAARIKPEPTDPGADDDTVDIDPDDAPPRDSGRGGRGGR